MAHPDVPAEQAYLDRAYERLEVVRGETQARLQEAFRERGGTFQSYTERDIKVRNSLNRLEKLQLGREALIFGRIDRPGHQDGEGAGASEAVAAGGERGRGEDESFHIGRLALSDAEHEPLVVDWRAPVAEPFYRATGARPMGLRRRRHFLTDGRRVVDLEDELFAPDGTEVSAEVLGLSGPGVLRAALERAHTGRMRDIVATVQAEQDEIIRSPLPGALVVQGGPGTGKTAVALHRAAYLLYTHRFPLEVQGVLVVGPNPTFLRYIDQVLPSLGETGAELSTASGLYKGAKAVATEPVPVARLKGDPRMARFIRRAVRQRERPLRSTAEIPYGHLVLTLTPQASTEIVSTAKRRSGPHNARRRLVERLLWEHFAAQFERRGDGPNGRPGGPGRAETGRGQTASGPVAPGSDEISASELGAELRRRPEIVELLERIWPRMTAEAFLHDLFGARPLIALAGNGALSATELDLLFRPRSANLNDVPWSPADVALLDEASWQLGPVRSEPATEYRSYGHIVVDEVQDLSPMELRMVGRRSLSGSMTLVGDIAQATGYWAPNSWDDLMAHLPARRGWRLASLSVSYRAPAEVMELAAHVLAAALPGARPPEPVRRTERRPKVLTPSTNAGQDGTAVWHALISRTVKDELQAVSAIEAGEDGSVGVLVPSVLLADTRSALEEGGVAFGEVGSGALDTPVSLLALGDAKGLEFDSVVVVEPARIVAQPPEGMRALYVAVTRCTRRLAILHREPLPAPLRGVEPGPGQGDGSSDGPDAKDAGTNLEGVGHPGDGAGEEGR
jgi:DNA helicase IV